MIRVALNALAHLIRAIWRMVRTLFRSAMGLVVVLLLVLNISMAVLPVVYDVVSRLVWGTVSIVAEGYAARSATQAARRSHIAEMETDVQEARARATGLQDQNARLRGEKMQIEARANALQAEADALRTREAALANESVHLRAEQTRVETRLRNTQTELNAAAARQRQAQAQAGETVRRMQQRSLRMISRNTATVFTDTLPLIGMVSIVGGIAWDVWDTCAQLSDLGELGQILNEPLGEESEEERRWCGLNSEEIFSRIFGGREGPEKACINARLRTRTLDPPECARFPWQDVDFADPLDQIQRIESVLPPLDDY